MTEPAPPRRWSLVVAWLLHLTALLPYWLTTLVAPMYAFWLLLAVWVGFGVLLLRVHRRYGPVALAVPLLAVLTWLTVISVGSALLDWTA